MTDSRVRRPRRPCVGVLVLMLSCAASAVAQPRSLSTEVDVTSGFSTERSVAAGAGQVRVFGETASQIRFNVEGLWADRSSDGTDAFGAAYPYGGQIQVGEAYGERLFRRGARVVAVRAGQYRTPFGLSHRSDHAYSGLSRAPLVRYDGYWALTNNFLERGGDVVVGSPRLLVEASLGRPADVGVSRRAGGASATVRAQTYLRSLTVGVSHLTSRPYGQRAAGAARTDVEGRLRFTGIDARWMHAGVQVRGEWMAGQPWDGPRTHGWYLDTLVHRPFMGPVTAVIRSERLHYRSPTPFPFGDEGELHEEWAGHRYSVGGRLRLPKGLTAQAAFVRQGGEMAEYGAPSVIDVAVTYSFRRR